MFPSLAGLPLAVLPSVVVPLHAAGSTVTVCFLMSSPLVLTWLRMPSLVMNHLQGYSVLAILMSTCVWP